MKKAVKLTLKAILTLIFLAGFVLMSATVENPVGQLLCVLGSVAVMAVAYLGIQAVDPSAFREGAE